MSNEPIIPSKAYVMVPPGMDLESLSIMIFGSAELTGVPLFETAEDGIEAVKSKGNDPERGFVAEITIRRLDSFGKELA